MAGWVLDSESCPRAERAKAQGVCRCLQLACGWFQARTLQLSPIS